MEYSTQTLIQPFTTTAIVITIIVISLATTIITAFTILIVITFIIAIVVVLTIAIVIAITTIIILIATIAIVGMLFICSFQSLISHFLEQQAFTVIVIEFIV